MTKITTDIEMTSEVGTIDDGAFGVRLTIVGLISEQQADMVAEWVYALVEQNMDAMAKACVPHGMKFSSMNKVSDSRDAETKN